MNRPRWLCALLAAAAATSACTAEVSLDPAAGSAPATAAAPSPAVTGPTGPAALDPESYRAEVEQAREPVREALSKLAKARSPKTLVARIEAVESELTSAADRLDGVVPPPEAASLHQRYIDSLRGFGDALGTLEEDVSTRGVCTASGALAALGRAAEFKELDRAGEALAELGDYPADVLTLKVPRRQTRRPANGTLLRNGGRGGRSQLTIKNGGGSDAVVTLVRGKTKTLSVYVRKKKSHTVPNIKDGTYKVYFTTGVDYDRKARAFTRDCAFERFEDSIRFQTVYTATQVRWQNWTLTLNRVVGGNARTRDVDPEDFPA